MNEVMERKILLTDEQKRQMLGDFYRSVARSAGYEEKEDTMYDCCRILVADNVQDAIIEAYQEANPNGNVKYYDAACDKRSKSG